MNNNEKNIIEIAEIHEGFPCDYIFYNTGNTDSENFLNLLNEIGEYQCEYHTPIKLDGTLNGTRTPYLIGCIFDVWKEYKIKDKIVLVRLKSKRYHINVFPYGEKTREDSVWLRNHDYLLTALVDYAFSLSCGSRDGRALKYNTEEMDSFMSTKDVIAPANYFHNNPEEFNKLFTIVPDEEEGVKALDTTELSERVERISFVTPRYTENGY